MIINTANGTCCVCGASGAVRPAHQQILYEDMLVDGVVCYVCFARYVIPQDQWGRGQKEEERAKLVPPHRFEVSAVDHISEGSTSSDSLEIDPLAHTEGNYGPPYQAERVDWILRMTRNRENILDCGCNQWMSERMGAIAGMDIDIHALKVHKACYPRRDLYWGNIQQMPFNDREFDCVVMGDVLEHQGLEGAERAVREALRVSGYLVATVPNFDDHAKMFWNPDYHTWEVKKTELEGLLSRVGGKSMLIPSPERHFYYFTISK